MTFAMLVNYRIHNIFDADEKPNFPPDPLGNEIPVIDITGTGADLNDGYNPLTEEVVYFPKDEEVPQKEGFNTLVEWDSEQYKFVFDFEPIPEPEPIIPSEQDLINAELLLGQALLMEQLMGVN